MLLQEQISIHKLNFAVQIFATDIDNAAIAKARLGIYPSSIASYIDPARLARFFSLEPDGRTYRIRKPIRDLLIFSEQDLIKDPPFSRLDLITCRNLLIYLSAELQHKVIPMFHYALNQGGLLMLGTSETVGEFETLFSCLDRRAKLYQANPNQSSEHRMRVSRLLTPFLSIKSIEPFTAGTIENPLQPSLRELTENTLLQAIAPSAALINGQGDILYLHGRTGKYLEMAPGITITSNILKMAREGLQFALATALQQAVSTRETIHSPGILVKINDSFNTVNLTICPVDRRGPDDPDTPLFLVSIVEDRLAPEIPDQPVHLDFDSSAKIHSLLQNLQTKEDHLQVANEELITANEAMQSINEEMQSTNEELETSKEELQSVNEELATVNIELQTKVTDLSQANNDMNNLLAGTGIATIFVDHNLRIMRYTPTATRIINLIPSDIGRPINHIVFNLIGQPKLVDDIRKVLDTLIPLEHDVQSADGKYWSLRILPYRTLDNVIEGAVISCFDITERRRLEKNLFETEAILQVAMDQSMVGIAIADAPDARIRYMNRAGRQILGEADNSALARVDSPQFVARWQMQDSQGIPLRPDEVPLTRAILMGEISSRELVLQLADGMTRRVLTNAAPVRNQLGAIIAGIAVFLDISDGPLNPVASNPAKTGQVPQDEAPSDLRDALIVQALDGKILAWNPAAAKLYGYNEKQALTMSIQQLQPPDSVAQDLLELIRSTGANPPHPTQTRRIAQDGRQFAVWLTATPLWDHTGTIYAIATSEWEIS